MMLTKTIGDDIVSNVPQSQCSTSFDERFLVKTLLFFTLVQSVLVILLLIKLLQS
jgi:hypothetical protein